MELLGCLIDCINFNYQVVAANTVLYHIKLGFELVIGFENIADEISKEHVRLAMKEDNLGYQPNLWEFVNCSMNYYLFFLNETILSERENKQVEIFFLERRKYILVL